MSKIPQQILFSNNDVGLSRDVCFMSPLFVFKVTGQLLSWFGLIWEGLVEVFLFSTEIHGI